MKKIVLLAATLAGVLLLLSTGLIMAGSSGVRLMSPTRQDQVYGPDITRVRINGSWHEENCHLFAYALVDSESGSDVDSLVELHMRLRDVDAYTAGNQPGTWDDPGLTVNGSGLPVRMSRIGYSRWHCCEIAAVDNATKHPDQYEITVTLAGEHVTSTTIDQAYSQTNHLQTSDQNHLRFAWDRNPH